MKKLDATQKIFLERAAIARWENALKRRKSKNKSNSHQKYGERREFGGWHPIVAPEDINVYEVSGERETYTKTLAFISEIQSRLGRGRCYVDFSATETLSAAAFVVLYAAVDTALSSRVGKGSVKVILSDKSEQVNSIIRNYNLYRLLTGEKVNYSLGGVRVMPVMSGVGNECMDEIIDFIQKKIYLDKMSAETEYVYGDAVSETIYNVELHAYPDSLPSEKRWWLICRVKGKMLHLAIYDKGVGIPKTVVQHPWFLSSVQNKHPKEYRLLLDKFPELRGTGLTRYVPTVISDDKLIYLSLQGDVSGTNRDRHGQGSKSIMALVNDTPGGRLWVFSNDGLCKYEKAGDEPELVRLPQSFPGTLIQWNIELP
ncbi:hypothetical protein [Pseudomonas sp. DP16D-R1]|uniref:hypothetical protein n=2 Tax=Pseudomonas sp. DP16D-R1 TaxID=2075551 RepID=UPI0011AEC956|nr:hypothetical protein [Pseudomonas sp. DP16D-R1]